MNHRLAAVNAILYQRYLARNKMTLTLLLDLDDTILQTGTDQFIQAYLGKLGTFLSPSVGKPADEIIQKLLRATRAMIMNQLPDRTLEQVFNAAFYPSLGIDYSTIKPQVDMFYSSIYPSLQQITKQAPGAREIIELARERAWNIVLATNPLFPETAVRQRLEWAGFNVDDKPFTFLTSFEMMHFSKPNPAYFAEILARLGCPEEPALVIGNDLIEDIGPASQAGIRTWWVNLEEMDSGEAIQPGSLAGTLDDLHAWLEVVEPETLHPDFSGVPSILAQMPATPAMLSTLARQLPDNKLTQRPAEDEWSLTEIFCHLRDVECEVNLPRLALIGQETNPFIAAEDTDLWAEQRKYNHQDGRLALREFTHARLQVINQISAMSAESWERTVRHAIFGTTTVRELFSFVTTHDRLHIQQADRTAQAAASPGIRL